MGQAIEHGGDLLQMGIPSPVVEAVWDRHTATWFSVSQAPDDKVFHSVGTHPGAC